MRAAALIFALVAFNAFAQPSPEETLSAVVAVSAKIPQGARSAATLGVQRRGSGALIREGYVLTIGSLIVGDAGGPGTRSPGNMFAPTDLLKPILKDLIEHGQRSGPARPWLGVNADEVRGRLFVSRLSPEGPGERAGLQANDIILAVGGDEVATLEEFYRKIWSRGAAGVGVPLKILRGAQIRELTVRSIDRARYFSPSKTY